jgi:glutathione synthase/RimK-type ligase-like ATP-grasp enzyme
MSISDRPAVALATYEGRPSLHPDDRLALDALIDRGADAVSVVWDDASIDWTTYDAVVVRSCWDQHTRPYAFTNWAVSTTANGTPVLNAPRTIRWNVHKSYLLSLRKRGHRVVPTAVIPRGRRTNLAAVLEQYGWAHAVVKPAISASAEKTWRTSMDRAVTDQRRFEELLADTDVLVQQYAPEIVDGEWSLVFLDGEYSHAVRKYPDRDDFRVQTHHGGSVTVERPGDPIVKAARAVMRDVPGEEDPLYVRVDGIERDGELVLVELECIAPFLFLGRDTDAPGRFADAVLDRTTPTLASESP